MPHVNALTHRSKFRKAPAYQIFVRIVFPNQNETNIALFSDRYLDIYIGAPLQQSSGSSEGRGTGQERVTRIKTIAHCCMDFERKQMGFQGKIHWIHQVRLCFELSGTNHEEALENLLIVRNVAKIWTAANRFLLRAKFAVIVHTFG